jgi:predicted RNase H-like HicB family nuclease
MNKNPKEYLNEPYSRVVIPDSESGTYTAMILEFPGCLAQGNSVQEAYELLEKVALSWIETALDSGQEIPDPSTVSEYGGKIALRLPKSLHKQVAIAAERDGTSLNQFIVMAVAERVGSVNLSYRLVQDIEQKLAQTGLSVIQLMSNLPLGTGNTFLGPHSLVSYFQVYNPNTISGNRELTKIEVN